MIGNDVLAIAMLGGYWLSFILILLLIKFVFSPPREIIRKGFHIFYSFSGFFLMYIFSSWLVAVLTVFVFFSLGYIYLIMEDKLIPLKLIEFGRNTGSGNDIKELKLQVLFVLVMQVVLIILFRPILNQPLHAVIGMLVWGVGDAAASLAGKNFGRLRFPGIIMSKNKSVEGTLTLIVTVYIFILTLQLIFNLFPFDNIFLFMIYSLLLAITTGLTEGIARRGEDNLTMPLAVALVSFLLISLL